MLFSPSWRHSFTSTSTVRLIMRSTRLRSVLLIIRIQKVCMNFPVLGFLHMHKKKWLLWGGLPAYLQDPLFILFYKAYGYQILLLFPKVSCLLRTKYDLGVVQSSLWFLFGRLSTREKWLTFQRYPFWKTVRFCCLKSYPCSSISHQTSSLKIPQDLFAATRSHCLLNFLDTTVSQLLTLSCFLIT